MVSINKILEDMENTGASKLQYRGDLYNVLAYKVGDMVRIDITKSYEE